MFPLPFSSTSDFPLPFSLDDDRVSTIVEEGDSKEKWSRGKSRKLERKRHPRVKRGNASLDDFMKLDAMFLSVFFLSFQARHVK